MSILTDLAMDSVSIMGTEDLGLAAFYQRKAGGAPVSLNAIIDYQSDMASVAPGQARIATIYVAESDIDRPAIYDVVTFTASGDEWTVQTATAGGGGVWTLLCYSDRRAGA